MNFEPLTELNWHIDRCSERCRIIVLHHDDDLLPVVELTKERELAALQVHEGSGFCREAAEGEAHEHALASQTAVRWQEAGPRRAAAMGQALLQGRAGAGQPGSALAGRQRQQRQ